MERMLASADPSAADSPIAPNASMNVLSISLVYPNPAEPGLGPFVHARLQHVASCTDLKVVAPIPVIDYSGPRGKFRARRSLPSRLAHAYCLPTEYQLESTRVTKEAKLHA